MAAAVTSPSTQTKAPAFTMPQPPMSAADSALRSASASKTSFSAAAAVNAAAKRSSFQSNKDHAYHTRRSSSASLKSPLSYPSALSPSIPSPAYSLKRGADGEPLKTPLTPPSAYLEFLKIAPKSPYSNSPLSTGTSTHFTYPSPMWPTSASALPKDTIECLKRRSRSPSPMRDLAAHNAASAVTPGGSSSGARSMASVTALNAATGNTPVSAKPPTNALHDERDVPVRDTTSAPPATGPNAEEKTSKTKHRPAGLSSVPERRNSDPLAPLCSPPLPTPRSARLNPPPRRPSLRIPPSPTQNFTPMSPAAVAAAGLSNPTSAAVAASSAGAMSANPLTAIAASPAGGLDPPLALEPGSAIHSSTRGGDVHPPPAKSTAKTASSGTSSPVTIRHVVTRTVTYQRPIGGPGWHHTSRGSTASVSSTGTGVSSNPPGSAGSVSIKKEDEESVLSRDREPMSAVDRPEGFQWPRVGDAPRGKRRRME